jgi:hypothetical protein
MEVWEGGQEEDRKKEWIAENKDTLPPSTAKVEEFKGSDEKELRC